MTLFCFFSDLVVLAAHVVARQLVLAVEKSSVLAVGSQIHFPPASLPSSFSSLRSDFEAWLELVAEWEPGACFLVVVVAVAAEKPTFG